MATDCIPAILTRCAQSNAQGLITHLIGDNMGFILTFALIMIIFSGVQYMYSGISPDAQKGAKNRIIGIVTGIVILYLIQAILNSITNIPGISAPSLPINNPATTATPTP